MIVAVDTGGTKTLVAVFDTDGRIVDQQKFPTPADISEYVTTLCNAIDRLTTADAITCISVALPGRIDEKDIMVGAGNLPWLNVDIKALLRPHYDCPVIIENDANLAGLGETRLLPEIPGISLYLTFSTGVGTGIIINGQLNKLFSRTEGGHAILEYEGSLQEWEGFASGAAIYKTYGKYGRDIDSVDTWREIADRMSRGLLAQIPLLQPDVVIFGGSMGVHFEKYGHFIKDTIEAHSHATLVIRPALLQAAHPEEAVIYGCYYYALDTAAA